MSDPTQNQTEVYKYPDTETSFMPALFSLNKTIPNRLTVGVLSSLDNNEPKRSVFRKPGQGMNALFVRTGDAWMVGLPICQNDG